MYPSWSPLPFFSAYAPKRSMVSRVASFASLAPMPCLQAQKVNRRLGMHCTTRQTEGDEWRMCPYVCIKKFAPPLARSTTATSRPRAIMMPRASRVGNCCSFHLECAFPQPAWQNGLSHGEERTGQNSCCAVQLSTTISSSLRIQDPSRLA